MFCSQDDDLLLVIFIDGLCPSCQDIKMSVCKCEETVSELRQHAQQVAPLVYDTDHQPRRHVSAATVCSYRPLNVRPTVISMFTTEISGSWLSSDMLVSVN